MVSFDDLPPHVKDLVFSRISYKDRFETGRVCTEWFELTLRNYRPVLEDGDQLLKDLVVFFNQRTNDAPSSWYDLLKLTKIDAAYLSWYTSQEFVAALKKYKPGIRRLFLDRMDCAAKYWDLFMSWDLESIRIALVGDTQFPSKFPKSVKKIHLKGVWWNTIVPLSHYCEEPNNIESLCLRIENSSSNFDPKFVFHNISKLWLYMPNDSASQEVALNAIRECSSLRQVTIIGGRITRRWFHLFRKNVKKVCISRLSVDSELEKQLGQYIDRSLLYFCCEHWESLELFRVTLYDPPSSQGRSYACSPVRRVEWISLERCSVKQLRNILVPNEWNCRKLRIEHIEAPNEYINLIPSSVEDLFVCFEDFGKTKFLPHDLLCDPSKLKHLTLKHRGVAGVPLLQLGSMHGMVSLTALKIDAATATCIATILTGCSCLQKLTFRCVVSRLFEEIPSDVASHSVIDIEIKDGDDELHNIMKHVPRVKRVRLIPHSVEAMKRIDPGMVSKLDFFSLETKYDHLLCLILSEVDLRYVAYFPASNNRILYCLSIDVDSVRNEYGRLCAQYCAVKCFSTRFMLGRTITTSPWDFSSPEEK